MAEKENKMGSMPVKKLIINMSVPMMISMLFQALYNIVDSLFVSRISQEALTAISIAFPMQNLMIAFASGTGVGINALLSRSLGEKNYKKADQSANTGLFLIFLTYILFIFIGLFVAGPFIGSQTNNPVIKDYAVTYTKICCLLSIGLFMQVTLERLLQSTGLTMFSMASQITGAIINIIFDPIMIFGLFGFPKLGIAGAAYATIFGQTVASLVGLTLNIKKNKDIHLSLKEIFSPAAEVVKKIYIVAVPSILMMSIGSIMTFMMNKILGSFDPAALADTAQAVFGSYFKLQSFFFMPVFGLNNGIIPVLAYNLGARKKDRITGSLKFAVKLAVAIMLIGMLCFEFIPATLLRIFDASDYMIQIGQPALRIIAFHFPLAAISIVLGSVFQAFSKSFYSLIVSVMRQLVVLIPAAWLLSKTGNVANVWWSFPIAEIISLTVTILCFKHISKTVIEKL